MNKLKLAHDWAMKHIQEGWDINYDVLVVEAWQYADAMQAEAEKRKPSGLPEALREEWQPDWSQAPEWAKWWAIREDSNTALWCINKPTVTDDCLFSHGGCSPAPSFGFNGSHVVERPHGF